MKRPGSTSSSQTVSSDAMTASRLQLLEAYVEHNDDVAGCASASLTWLAREANIQTSLCLAVDADGTMLVGLAGHGVSAEEVERFSWPLRDAADPLTQALASGSPVAVASSVHQPSDRRRTETPLGDVPFTAVPLGRKRRGDRALGLLLVAGPAALPDTVGWLATVLGEKIYQVRGRGTLGQEVRRLRHERGLLSTIINAVADPIVLTDTSGRVVVANSQAERLMSASASDGETHRHAVDLNNIVFSAAIARVAGEGRPAVQDLTLVDPVDGSDLFFELLATPVNDPPGPGFVSVLRNVTELRRATDQLEENYRRLRVAESAARAERDRLNLIIDSVADPIIVTDQHGATMLTNVPAAELFTLTGDDEAERRAVRANDVHFSSFISGLLLGEGGPGETRRGELPLTHPRTGESIPVEAVAGKVMADTGELSAVVTILHDQREALERARLYEQVKASSEELQERVQAATAELATQNELLRRQAFELEHASRLKSQFLANMSHEFRTPLNAILGYTQMLLQGLSGELRAPVKRQLERVDSNGRHLLAIINEILDITRIEAGRMPVQVSRFDLNELVPEVIAELYSVIARSHLEVKTRPAPHPVVVRSDRQKVKQILVNLVSNALKFTHEGSVEIATAVADDGRSASVSVADTGIGIAPENFDNIFEDFRQVDDSPSRQYGGTGLGLSICRRLAAAIGSRITMSSTVGRGSTFTLRIPLEEES